jgi:hypothetical protein
MALITTKVELNKYLPVAYANLAAQMPRFEEAEEKSLIQILGEELYGVLNDNYGDENITPRLTKLLGYCQAVIAPMAYVLNIPFLQGLITDNGIVVNESNNARKAFRWEYNEVVKALQEKGYSAMESLIIFLTENRADYEEWESSPYNDASEFAIIRNGKELRKSYASLTQPHRLFILVKPIFMEVAELFIKPSISDEYYTALNARIITGSTTEADDAIIGLLQMATTRMVMKKAAFTMSVKFTEMGVTITSAHSLSDNAASGETDAGDKRLMKFSEENETSAKALMAKIVTYMNKTASEIAFAEYYASALYVDPTAAKTANYKNDQRKGIFIAN